eukprot:07418.XXX_290443_291097_1 [CDS] Oithona nana genome sequencing.
MLSKKKSQKRGRGKAFETYFCHRPTEFVSALALSSSPFSIPLTCFSLIEFLKGERKKRSRRSASPLFFCNASRVQENICCSCYCCRRRNLSKLSWLRRLVTMIVLPISCPSLTKWLTLFLLKFPTSRPKDKNLHHRVS